VLIVVLNDTVPYRSIARQRLDKQVPRRQILGKQAVAG
jgi:hypothetical protein